MSNPQTIIPPEGGWEERTVYLVEVSFDKTNPIHRALFNTGFLNGHKGGPGGYNDLWGSYDRTYEIRDVYYMKAIRKVVSADELDDTKCEFHMPPEPDKEIQK